MAARDDRLEPQDPVALRPSDAAAPPSLQPHPSPSLTPSTLRPHLASLLVHLSHSSTSSPSTPAMPPDVLEAIDQCMQHISTPSAATPSQTGAFLSALTASAYLDRPDVIAVCASVMRNRTVRLDWSPPAGEAVVGCDIVGTGGDGKDTFNVSTTAAILVSGVFSSLPPAPTTHKVLKHGNRASSSTSGSADLLLSLSVPLTSLPPQSLPPLSRRCAFSFLFAPSFHPSLAALAPLRKELGFPTVFNLLGPLLNPASPGRMVLGVPRKSLGPTYARALQLLGGIQRAWVVCGEGGLDECSIAGPTDVWEVREGVDEVKSFTIDPEAFGLKRHPLSHVAGGRSADENAHILRLLLSPDSRPRQEEEGTHLSAIRDFVLLNAAALLVVAGVVERDDLRGAEEMARRAMEGGDGWRALQRFREEAERKVERPRTAEG